MKKPEGYLYKYSVGYDAIDNSDVVNILKNLMENNNIK